MFCFFVDQQQEFYSSPVVSLTCATLQVSSY
jgi:hypothetical protein